MLDQVIVSQLGSRQHYQIPAMAHGSGQLARLITDAWSPPGSLTARLAALRGVPMLRRLAGRHNPEIPVSHVSTVSSVALHSLLAATKTNRYESFIALGKRFATATNKHLDFDHDAFIGFSCASFESIAHERRQGRHTVLDQVDAAQVDYRIRREEQSRFPTLPTALSSAPEPYFDRLQQEWHSADQIVVNSEWSRSALVEQGVCPEKIAVIPIAFQPRTIGTVRVMQNRIKVLWLGALDLIKGLAYAVAAARMLVNAPVTFTFCGSLATNPTDLQLPTNASYLGPITRAATHEVYSTHDVFIFPTLSDGFGITQLEAMSNGLPVIATTRCGSVVEHGSSGFIVPASDPKAIAEAITAFLDDRNLLPTMSLSALQRVRSFLPSEIWPQWQRVLRPSAKLG